MNSNYTYTVLIIPIKRSQRTKRNRFELKTPKNVFKTCRVCYLLKNTRQKLCFCVLLLGLQLLANAVRNYFGPVNFCSSHRQLSTERFECGIGHGLVIFRDSCLIIVFCLLDQSYDFFSRSRFIRDHQRFTAFFRRHQLHISVFIIMNLRQNSRCMMKVKLETEFKANYLYF